MASQHSGNDASGSVPDWRSLVLVAGVLPEPTSETNRLLLWLPGDRHDECQRWERIGNVPNTEFAVERGIYAAAATSVSAKQWRKGFWGKLRDRFGPASDDRSWILPNGERAKQFGNRNSDLLLVWTIDTTVPLDVAWIMSRWPSSKRCRPLAKNLFLISGVELPGSALIAEQVQTQSSPRAIAERMLASAREQGDSAKIVTALVDLGSVQLSDGDAQNAVLHFDEALRMARDVADRDAEIDVLTNMGFALVLGGHPHHAIECLLLAVSYARERGDRFAEKNALERLGIAYEKVQESAHAVNVLEQALALARAVGHQSHEGNLLWMLAIHYADLGQRSQSIEYAQKAIDLMVKLEDPRAPSYAEHLQKYRTGETGVGLATGRDAGAANAFLGESVLAGAWGTRPGDPTAPSAVHSPGLLRMAVSAARSMSKFVGSGFKTVPLATLQGRLRTCAVCPHHTGIRCRICGCFTNAKARLVHEQCPIGKWHQ